MKKKLFWGLLVSMVAFGAVLSPSTTVAQGNADDVPEAGSYLAPLEGEAKKKKETNPLVKGARTDINFTPEERSLIVKLQKEYALLEKEALALPRNKYTFQPIVGSSYVLGELNQRTINHALATINYNRSIAGIHHLGTNQLYNEYSQYAALGMAATRTMSHGLVGALKPGDMPANFWENGLKYTNDSVLHGAYEERGFSDHLAAYLFDYGTGNRNVGHRAWLLSWQMNEIGFGYAQAETTDSKSKPNFFTASYIRDDRNKTTTKDKVVSWPAAGVFPTNLMVNSDMPTENLRWSASFNMNGYKLTEKTGVTLTNTTTNEDWLFSSAAADGDFNLVKNNSGNYSTSGGYYTVMFQPGTTDKPFHYDPGDLFKVSVTGLEGLATSYEYQVRLFDVADTLPETVPTSVTINQDYIVAGIGKGTPLKATITPASATNKGLTWTSSDGEIASVDNQGIVTAHQYGRVVIKATSDDNADVFDDVTIITDDHGDTSSTGTRLSIGTAMAGVMDIGFSEKLKGLPSGGDSDYFNYQVEQAGNYLLHGFATQLSGEQDKVAVSYWLDRHNKWIQVNMEDFTPIKLSAGEKIWFCVYGTYILNPMTLTPIVNTAAGSRYVLELTDKTSLNYGSLEVDPPLGNYKVGDSVTLSGKVINSNILDPYYGNVYWKSNNSTIAKVDRETGVVTMVGPGSATITAYNSTGIMSVSTLSKSLTIKVE